MGRGDYDNRNGDGDVNGNGGGDVNGNYGGDVNDGHRLCDVGGGGSRSSDDGGDGRTVSTSNGCGTDDHENQRIDGWFG